MEVQPEKVHLTVNQAKHVPQGAVQTNSHASIQEGWHQAGSLEGFALCHGHYFGYIVDIVCAAWTEIDGARAKVSSFLGRRGQMLKALPERQVDQLLELHTAPLVESLERRSDIIVEGHCSSHASKHNIFDALMQPDRRGRFVNRSAPEARAFIPLFVLRLSAVL